jgi:hypothetical protein
MLATRAQVPADQSAIPYTLGPPRSGTRPAGAPSAHCASWAATSLVSTGWNRQPGGEYHRHPGHRLDSRDDAVMELGRTQCRPGQPRIGHDSFCSKLRREVPEDGAIDAADDWDPVRADDGDVDQMLYSGTRRRPYQVSRLDLVTLASANAVHNDLSTFTAASIPSPLARSPVTNWIPPMSSRSLSASLRPGRFDQVGQGRLHLGVGAGLQATVGVDPQPVTRHHPQGGGHQLAQLSSGRHSR